MNQEQFLKMQLQMRNNNAEYAEFLDNIDSWKNDINHNKEKCNITETKNSSIPIRNSIFKTKKVENDSTKVNSKKISAYNYLAWDKYDVDKAIEDIDSNDLNTMDLPETKNEIDKEMIIKEYKDIGNLRFKEGKYAEAIEEYTNALQLDPTNDIIFSNRAIALIKLSQYEDALCDCNKSLSININNLKSLYRRALCHEALNMYDKAINDLENLLKLDSSNKSALQLMNKCRGVVKPIPTSSDALKQQLARISITQVSPNVQSSVSLSIPNEQCQVSPIPRNSFQLCKVLRQNIPTPIITQYILQIPPSKYQQVIGQALDTHILSLFIKAFVELECQDMVNRLNTISQVDRFNSSLQMLSSDELNPLKDKLCQNQLLSHLNFTL